MILRFLIGSLSCPGSVDRCVVRSRSLFLRLLSLIVLHVFFKIQRRAEKVLSNGSAGAGAKEDTDSATACQHQDANPGYNRQNGKSVSCTKAGEDTRQHKCSEAGSRKYKGAEALVRCPRLDPALNEVKSK